MTNIIEIVDHSKKTITSYEISDAVIESAKELFSIFKEVDNTYSIGYQRYISLSAAKVKRMNQALLITGVNIQDIYSEIISTLEAMTQEEFNSFKKQK